MSNEVDQIKASPLGLSATGYRGSVLDFSPRPEHTTGNVLVAAAYRAVKLATADERHLPLDQAEQLSRRLIASDPAVWTPLVGNDGGLVSPALGGQGKKQPMQLVPYVPALANWTGVIGKGGRRWKPSKMVLATLWAGVPPSERDAWVSEVRTALSADKQDDMLAFFVQNAVAGVPLHESIEQGDDSETMSPPAYDPRLVTPATQLVEDLRRVFPLKPHLTRKQWIALVEGLIRLGVSMQFLWVLRACDVIWRRAHLAAAGGTGSGDGLVEDLTMTSRRNWILAYGESATGLRRQLKDHGRARIGLNLLFAHMNDTGHPPLGMGTSERWLDETAASLDSIAKSASKEFAEKFGSDFAHVVEDNQSQVNATSGTLRNSLFFLRYGMGQLNASDASERFQDASYCIAHHEGGKTSRVEFGSATLLALAHACCSSRAPVPVTLEDFRDHLAHYGILAPTTDERDQLGETLESLGLLVDSPDASGGRILINPFGGLHD